MSRIASVVLTILVLLGAMGVQAEVPPVLTLHLAPYFAAGPVIDGKLDDAAWRTAPENSTFYKYWTTAAEATPLRTAFRLGYDAKGLFLGANMYEKEPDKIKATIAQRQDPRLWTDDCAEIYVDSAGSGTGYRKFSINALGTTQTLYRWTWLTATRLAPRAGRRQRPAMTRGGPLRCTSPGRSGHVPRGPGTVETLLRTLLLVLWGLGRWGPGDLRAGWELQQPRPLRLVAVPAARCGGGYQRAGPDDSRARAR